DAPGRPVRGGHPRSGGRRGARAGLATLPAVLPRLAVGLPRARRPAAVPGPECPRLLTVAADGHVAPGPGAVLRGVVEGPLAVLGRAGLEPRPGSIVHRPVGDCEQAAEGAVEPWSNRRHGARALVPEAHHQL